MLENLTTETRNEKTMTLDQMSPLSILQTMNEEDKKVALAVEKELSSIEKLTTSVTTAFQNKGRLIYIGAGTSGRLGVLDAVECPPTFGTKPEQVVGLIAGGEKAFVLAVEGAEDSETLAKEDLQRIGLSANDVVIGIAASGRTPYVIGGLKYAREVGAVTGSISCNKGAKISSYSDHAVEVELGPEILTGSTRLKAGTAQKLILNMISTTAMIGIGKVYKNLMVDVKPTNEKLVERSKRIIMQATECDKETASSYYEAAEGHVKTAIVMLLTNCSFEEAKEKLDKANGFISQTK